VRAPFERGRLQTVTGRGAGIQADFQPVLDQYARNLEDDSGPGIGVLQAWLAQGHYRAGRYAEALQALHESIRGLQAEPSYADERVGVRMGRQERLHLAPQSRVRAVSRSSQASRSCTSRSRASRNLSLTCCQRSAPPSICNELSPHCACA